MSTYYGDKSLDGEIYLNLITGNLTMDYTLNKHGSSYDSNCLTLSNEHAAAPALEKLKKWTRTLPISCFALVYFMTMIPLITFLNSHGLLKNKQYQVEHQRIMKELCARCWGTYLIVKDAPFKESVVSVYVRNNLWLGYTLDGECQDKIKSIALTRNFMTHTLWGYKIIRQRGWTLTFEFTGIPLTGKCVVEHV